MEEGGRGVYPHSISFSLSLVLVLLCAWWPAAEEDSFLFGFGKREGGKEGGRVSK